MKEDWDPTSPRRTKNRCCARWPIYSTRTGDLGAALETNQRIAKLFPDDSLEASELAIKIAYEMKKLSDDQAEQSLAALTQKIRQVPRRGGSLLQARRVLLVPAGLREGAGRVSSN